MQTQKEEITFPKDHTLSLFIPTHIVEEEHRSDEEHKHQ